MQAIAKLEICTVRIGLKIALYYCTLAYVTQDASPIGGIVMCFRSSRCH